VRSTVSLSVSLWLVLAAAVLPASAQNSQGLALNAESVLLLDADGKVLFAKNRERTMPPASLVKLMTLYLAFEDLGGGQRWNGTRRSR
jgi:D-alanyl-D-alanine carboxypeptidase (penicillin-binding protein 5/6)